MNKLFFTTLLPASLLAIAVLSACDNDKDFPSTGKPGCPSLLEYADGGQFSLSYADRRPFRILSPEGSATQFNYENGVLSSLSFSPPEGVADGHASISFERESEHIIRVKQSGEPSWSTSRIEEIELDDNGYPVRITDLGIYQYRGSTPETMHYELIREGKTYTRLSFDLSTGHLLKREVYNRADSALLSSSRYEYTSTPGLFSAVDLPRWFTGYWCDHVASQSDPYYRLYYHTHTNLLKETVVNAEGEQISTLTYDYTYDRNGFPNQVSNQALPAGLRIRY